MDIVIKKTEKVSMIKVNNLYKSPLVDEFDKIKLRKYKKLYVQGKGFRVEYEHAQCSYNYGRIYPINMAGLSGFSRKIRNYLARDIYFNYDQVNSAPNLLYQLLLKNGLDNSFLKNYVENTIQVRENLMNDLNKSKKEIKQFFFNIIFNSEFKSNNNSFNELNDTIYNKLIGILSIHDDYKEIYDKVMKCKKTKIDIFRDNDFEFNNKKSNKKGRFLALVLQNLEWKTLESTHEFLRSNGYNIDVFIHDGFMSDKQIDHITLMNCVDYVKDKTGYNICIEEEPMNDIIDISSSEDIDVSPLTKQEEVIDYIFKSMEGNYRHDELYVYKRDANIPILYHKINKFNKWIDSLFQTDNKYLRYYRTLNKESLCNSLLCRDDPEFRFMNNTKNILVLLDGFFDYRNPYDVKFVDFNSNYDKNITTISIVNKKFSDFSSTEKFNNYLKSQLPDNVIEYFKGMVIGRSFYNLGQFDKYEFFPYIFGEPQTGKTLFCNLLNMLNPNIGFINVGSYSTNFCLEPFVDKDLGIMDDMPEYLDTIIDATNLQKMSSGQMMTINIKNKTPIHLKWEIMVVIISNYFLKIRGNDKAIARRFMCFNFPNKILNGNAGLVDELFNEEIIGIITECCKSYINLINRHKHTTFYTWNIEYFNQFQNQFLEEENILQEYLNSDRILIDEEGSMLFSDFKTDFIRFQKKNDRKYIKQRITAGDLLSNFPNNEIEIKQVKICKFCRKFDGSDCCDKYDNKNRTSLAMIFGLKFNDSDTDSDHFVI